MSDGYIMVGDIKKHRRKEKIMKGLSKIGGFLRRTGTAVGKDIYKTGRGVGKFAGKQIRKEVDDWRGVKRGKNRKSARRKSRFKGQLIKDRNAQRRKGRKCGTIFWSRKDQKWVYNIY